MFNRAFTLIEVMVVIVVVATLSAMLVPSLMGSQRRAALTADTQRFAETARYAQRMAVLKGRTLQLVVLPTNTEQGGQSSYHLELNHTDVDAAVDQPFELLRDGVAKPVTLTRGVRITSARVYAGTPDGETMGGSGELQDTSGRYAVTFRPDGSADAAMIEIGPDTSLNSPASPRRTVVIEAATGRVGVFEHAVAGVPSLRRDLDE